MWRAVRVEFLLAVLTLDTGSSLLRPVSAEDAPEPQPASLAGPTLAGRAVAAELSAKLNRRISLNLEEQELQGLIEYLEEQTGAPFRIDRISLEETGIILDEPITGKYVDLPVRNLLTRVLEPLDLTWMFDNESVLITTTDFARDKLTTRSIDVQQLLEWIKADTVRPQRDRFGRADAPPRSGLGGLRFATTAELQLTEVVITGARGLWEQSHGSGGSISYNEGVATIRQSPPDLDIALRLIRVLQHVSARPPEPLVWYVEEDGYMALNTRDVISKLHQKTTVGFADTPLADAVAFLSRDSGLPVWLDVVSLEESGIPPDEPVTVTAEASLHAILRTVLDDLQLEYLPRDNGLFVTTRDIAFETHVSAVFDVRDLTQKKGITADTLRDMIMQETSGLWENSGGVMSFVGGLLVVRQDLGTLTEIEVILHDLRDEESARARALTREPANGEAAEVTRFYRVPSAADIDSLREALVTFVFPDKWASNGGTGEMVEVGSSLVIRQTPEVHKAIGDFLKELNNQPE